MQVKHWRLKFSKLYSSYSNCPQITELVIATFSFYCSNFWCHPTQQKTFYVTYTSHHKSNILPYAAIISQHLSIHCIYVYMCLCVDKGMYTNAYTYIYTHTHSYMRVHVKKYKTYTFIDFKLQKFTPWTTMFRKYQAFP